MILHKHSASVMNTLKLAGHVAATGSATIARLRPRPRTALPAACSLPPTRPVAGPSRYYSSVAEATEVIEEEEEEEEDTFEARRLRGDLDTPPHLNGMIVAQPILVDEAVQDLMTIGLTYSSEVLQKPKIEKAAAVNLFTELESGEIIATKARVKKVKAPRRAKVAKLSLNLQRVLFSPGVHHLRDPRTGVWNFHKTLEKIPTPDQFAFDRVPQYITASQDTELAKMARDHQVRFVGSTSTLTQALSQFYFAMNGGRGVDLSALTSEFASERQGFTAGAQLPASLTLRYQEKGAYAVDNDKQYSIDENVLSHYGRILEKMLTAEPDDFARFLKTSPSHLVPESERNEREAYGYCKGNTLLMRSQLDCHDSRLPGTGVFDIKTRACLPIRYDRANYINNSAYDISQLTGFHQSFEREYYDLSRSGMLKFSFQARIGQMDGIFVAYHNTVRCFGFQYLPLTELDTRLFGSTEMAEQGFNLCVALFERLLERATECFPNQSVSLMVQRNKPTATDPAPSTVTAWVQPLEWNEPASKPVRAIKIDINNEINGESVGGENIVFSTNPKTRQTDQWTAKYNMTITPDTYAGHRIAKSGLSNATKELKQMNSLWVPDGKTPEEMTQLSALKQLKTGTGSGPGSDGSSATVTWKKPAPFVHALRREAVESGEAYLARRNTWNKKSQTSSWWQHAA